MLTRLAAGWAALALLLAGTPQPSVLAKPPGLPIDPKVKYQESPSQHEIHSEPINNDTEIELAFGGGQAGQHAPGTLLFGIGLNSQTGVVCNLTFAMGGKDCSSSETSDLFSQVRHLLLDRLDGTHGFMGIEVNGEVSSNSPDMEQVTPVAPAAKETKPLPRWPSGAQVRCTVWLGGLSVTTNAGPEGHGALMFGLRYARLTDAATFLLEHGDVIVDCLSKSFGGE